MTPCPTTLPAGYKAAFQIDLQKDKKLALLVNFLATVIAVILFLAMQPFVSIFTLFNFDQGMLIYVLKFAVMIVGIILYLFLHELTHGVFMKHFSGQKPSYGFNVLYAYAGSTAYFSKLPYLIIAMAPVVLLGLVLLVLNLLVPAEWFYVVYLIQVVNLSGAAGDFYVTARFSRLPKDILVQDLGVSMTVFERQS